ncbi:unnamed protein product [Durusdinium trenchii]|uniref:Poly [ADP-ribose] polymerase n=2 Tax=Durusdinium trenchii TaxID=1381693 RepID=A0ABP0K3M7_9DINO
MECSFSRFLLQGTGWDCEAKPVKREDDEECLDNVGHDDIGGCEEAISQIREMIELPLRHPTRFMSLGATPPASLLLYGPPGSGKTLIARAIANETSASFFLINGRELMSNTAGEAKSKLRKVFKDSEKNSPAIIFIDDIDSITLKDETCGDRANSIVFQPGRLIRNMNSLVRVMAATHDLGTIHSALLPFDRLLNIGAPDDNGRLKILRIHCKNMKLARDVFLQEVAVNTDGFHGADLAQLCNEAGQECRFETELDPFSWMEESMDISFLDSMAVSQKDFESVIGRMNADVRMENGQLKNVIRQFNQKIEQLKNENVQLKKQVEVEQDRLRRFDLQPQLDGETWQYQARSGEWATFQDKHSLELIHKFLEGHQTCELMIDGQVYEYDFNRMVQTNKRTKRERRIRFCSNLPEHWRISDCDFLKMLQPGIQGNGQEGSDHRISLVTDSAILSTLENLLNRSNDGTVCSCLHGESTFRLVEAYQIKNWQLWRRYQRHVRSIVEKHKQFAIKPTGVVDPPVGEALTQFAKDIEVNLEGNEFLLLHGTRDFDLAQEIANEGFDSRIARSGGLYGSGTYFAAQTCKSAQYATHKGREEKASRQMIGTVLVARVAIGDPFYTPKQCPDQKRPPKKPGSRCQGGASKTTMEYDSIIAKPGIPNGQRNGQQAHMEFVTFALHQSYPEYILRFIEE